MCKCMRVQEHSFMHDCLVRNLPQPDFVLLPTGRFGRKSHQVFRILKIKNMKILRGCSFFGNQLQNMRPVKNTRVVIVGWT